MNPEEALIKYYGGKAEYSGGKLSKIGSRAVSFANGKISRVGGDTKAQKLERDNKDV